MSFDQYNQYAYMERIAAIPRRSIDDLIGVLRDVNPDMVGFDMTRTHLHARYSGCGTACCIGGHAALALGAVMLHIGLEDIDWEREVRFHDAVQLFGVPETLAMDLCCPPPHSDGWAATIPEAIRALELVRDEGIVNWDRAIREVAELKDAQDV